MGAFLTRKPGFYYCERCLDLNRITGGVRLFKRKKMKDLPPWMDWIPLCDKHLKDYEPYIEKITLTGLEPIFKDNDR